MALAPTSPQRTGTTPGPGQVSLDYTDSYDQWYERVVADLIRRYTQGLGGKGSDDPELGEPAAEDFGRYGQNGANGDYSLATEQYWERFVAKYGATDPFVAKTYGPAPTRTATYVQDPNSAGAITDKQLADAAASRAHQAEQNRLAREADLGITNLNNASSERIASGNNQSAMERLQAQLAADRAAQESQQGFIAGESALDRGLAREESAAVTGRIREQITSNEKIANQDDITRRYIAEGEWGMQKFVTETQEKGMMDRLLLELGQRDEELAQNAEAEANRHHETMVSLIMEVAQYDAEMAAQPVNWLKYAGWLKNRGQVINGMTLAMAADTVPDSAISPEEVASSGMPGASIAATQTYEDQMQTGQGAIQTVTDPAAQQSMGAANATAATSTQPTPVAPTAAGSQQPANYKGIDLNNKNYGNLFDQIMGLNPNAAVDGVDNSQANIQGTLNSLDTSGVLSAGQGGGGFGLNGQQFSFNGNGAQNDIRKYAAMNTDQQKMAAGAAAATGNTFDVFLGDMMKAKPKGGGRVEATAYG